MPPHRGTEKDRRFDGAAVYKPRFVVAFSFAQLESIYKIPCMKKKKE
jgi:hypothetical protein